MTPATTNKDLYAGREFLTWLDSQNLLKAEEYLITKYLNPDLLTVDAGTNGGRIAQGMRGMGFTALAGFDYIPALIEQAIIRDPARTIDFQVQDATGLAYLDNSFDQIVYLQQILCTMESAADRLNAVKESYRILKPNGIGLFSVLSFESRTSGAVFSSYYTYLKMLRKLRGDSLSIQYFPWLRAAGKPNFGAILDRGPYSYWYLVSEAYELLKSVGFEILAMGSEQQIITDQLKTTDRELLAEQISGHLYFVVKK
jgi:SAM-dependent methyltransferase